MSGTVRRTATREVYRNRWMSVREDDVVYADGSPGLYGVVDKADYALVIPRDGGRLHLVEQYRYPVEGRYWEFPQGSWPATEQGAPVELARRELQEETGLHAGRMTPLGFVHVAYGYSSQRCHVFLAEDLTEGQTARESSETDMVQRWVPQEQIPELVASGSITDAATLAAYTLLRMHDVA